MVGDCAVCFLVSSSIAGHGGCNLRAPLGPIRCTLKFQLYYYYYSVPVIWQNSLHMEEHASDLAELPVPVIWQN